MRRFLLLALLATAAGCVSPQPKVVVVHRDRYIAKPTPRQVDLDAEVDRDLDAALAAEWPEPTAGESSYLPPPPRQRAPGETDRVLYVTQTPVVVLGTRSSYRGRYYSSYDCGPRYVAPCPPVVNNCGPVYGGNVTYGSTYNGHGRGYSRNRGVYGGINYSSPRVSVGFQSRSSCAPRSSGVRVGVRFR